MSVHFDLPFRLGADGQFATIKQDSPGDIVVRVTGILRSRLLTRDDAPDFGIPDPTFRQGGADLEAIAGALEKFDPAAARVLSRDPAALQSIVDHVQITERKATG